MTTTLYKIEYYENNTYEYSLDPCGLKSAYGTDDGGGEYSIPNGYYVGIGNDKRKHFYNDKNENVSLVTINDKPALQIFNGALIWLKKV